MAPIKYYARNLVCYSCAFYARASVFLILSRFVIFLRPGATVVAPSVPAPSPRKRPPQTVLCKLCIPASARSDDATVALVVSSADEPCRVGLARILIVTIAWNEIAVTGSDDGHGNNNRGTGPDVRFDIKSIFWETPGARGSRKKRPFDGPSSPASVPTPRGSRSDATGLGLFFRFFTSHEDACLPTTLGPVIREAGKRR